MEYIKPEESIILNVLPASVDFTTCESICMSRRVDSTGERTLAVVTKCDISRDGLLEKVIANDVNIGLGYTCVRNRINDETYDEARVQEAKLFETHPLLSKIDSSMVGIPVLANKLVQIQSQIISKCLPDIVKKINQRLHASISDFNKLPITLTSVPDAMVALMQIVGSLKETLQRILIRGESDQYEDDKQMHCNARLVEMLDEFSKELKKNAKTSLDFLVEEMNVLEDANGIRLPHFLPHSVFLCLLHRKVNTISDMPVSFVDKVCAYLEIVCARVLVDCCGNYPQLFPSMRKATLCVMTKMKLKFMERVMELIEMEKITDYTCDPDYMGYYNMLMGSRDQFVNALKKGSGSMTIEGYGTVNISHLITTPVNTRDQAFDLKMRMTAYWKHVLRRMVDSVALKLRFLMQKVVNDEIEVEIMSEVMVRGGGIEKMLNEPPLVAKKRERLQRSIDLLQESKEVIEQVIDGIVVTD